jgi:hypothetical protein
MEHGMPTPTTHGDGFENRQKQNSVGVTLV